MQPFVLDEIDVRGFNEITLAMVITNLDIEPADLPTALAEILDEEEPKVENPEPPTTREKSPEFEALAFFSHNPLYV